MIRSLLSIMLFCCGVFFLPSVHANEETLSSLWLSYTEDGDDVQNVLVDLNIGLDADNTLIMRAGETKSPFLSQTVTTNQYYIGLSSFRVAPWRFDIGFDYWGKDREMVTKTLQLGSHWNSEDWTLGLNVEYREIDFYTRTFAVGQFKVETESYAYGPSLLVYWDNLSLGLYGMWYDYADDPARLNNLYSLIILGTKTWTHAASLNDWYAGGQWQYAFDAVRLGMNYAHTVASIDKSASDNISISLGIDIIKDVHVDFEVGRVYQEQDVETDFGTIALGFDF